MNNSNLVPALTLGEVSFLVLKKVVFSVNPAHVYLFEEELLERKWSFVWKLQVPPRI